MKYCVITNRLGGDTRNLLIELFGEDITTINLDKQTAKTLLNAIIQSELLIIDYKIISKPEGEYLIKIWGNKPLLYMDNNQMITTRKEQLEKEKMNVQY